MTDTLECPCCDHTIDVSDEDPDATLSDMWEHLFVRHAGYSHDNANQLLAKVIQGTR